MAPEKPTGQVQYQSVDDAYFEKRGLRRYARTWSPWALGVGAVISGDFFGWNFGINTGDQKTDMKNRIPEIRCEDKLYGRSA